MGSSDEINVIFGQAQEIVSTVTNQVKSLQETQNSINNSFKVTVTPGIWEGSGAENFGQFVVTQYLPAIAELIAAIAGFGGGLTDGLNIMQSADQSTFGQISDLVGGFNFF